MAKKIRTGAFKQGPKQRNIRGKENKYRPGTYAYIKAQHVRDKEAYTIKYNTKRVYIYGLMTDAEKLKVYEKERRKLLSLVSRTKSKYGLDFSEVVKLDFETTESLQLKGLDYKAQMFPGSREGQIIPTAKQFMATGHKIKKGEIEELIRLQNRIKNILNQYKDDYGRQTLREDEILINELFKRIGDEAVNAVYANNNQSEDLIHYKEEGLKQRFRDWLLSGDIEARRLKLEQLRKEYDYIVSKIIQYFKDSDESYKEEINKATKAYFQTTVMADLGMIFEYRINRFAAQNGIQINNFGKTFYSSVMLDSIFNIGTKKQY